MDWHIIKSTKQELVGTPCMHATNLQNKEHLYLRWIAPITKLFWENHKCTVIKIYRESRSECLDPAKTKSHIVKRNLQELPVHQRGDAVSSMVYEANARLRDPVYGCVGAISSLQQQIDVLQTQLALAQAEVVHLRVRQTASFSPHGLQPGSPSSSGSPSSKLVGSNVKPIFDMDHMVVDQASFGESMWSC